MSKELKKLADPSVWSSLSVRGMIICCTIVASFSRLYSCVLQFPSFFLSTTTIGEAYSDRERRIRPAFRYFSMAESTSFATTRLYL